MKTFNNVMLIIIVLLILVGIWYFMMLELTTGFTFVFIGLSLAGIMFIINGNE